MKTFIDKMDYAVKNWWLSLLVGLLYIIVAIYLMFAPLASYVALSILFSVSMFVSGLFEIAFALANKKGISSWGWYLAGGIIDLILGIFLMASPGLSMEVLPAYVQRLLGYRLLDGPETIRYTELGLVHGLRYLGYPLLHRCYLATRPRGFHVGLHDRLCLINNRYIPCHAILRTEKPA